MRAIFLLGLGLLMTAPAAAEPLLATMFADHAVLQRGQPIRVYGHAVQGAAIRVSLNGNIAESKTDAEGRWQATLPAMPAGGPYTLDVQGGGQSQQVKDILLGDVFLCSGQSNMELPVSRAGFGAQEARTASDPLLRHVAVPRVNSPAVLPDFKTPLTWQLTTPEVAGAYSAACYYFGRELRKHTQVPVGLIESVWPGTRLREWVSEPTLRRLGMADADLDLLALHQTDPMAAQQRWGAVWQAWWTAKAGSASQPWAENAGGDWTAAPAALGPWANWPGGPSDPHGMTELGVGLIGQMWLRTTVTLTPAQAAQAATLALGSVTEEEISWVNGKALGGSSGDRTVLHPIPAGVLHAGINRVVINVFCSWKNCGLTGNNAVRAIHFADGGSAPLDAGWQYQIVPLSYGAAPQLPWGLTHGLVGDYNGLIAPIGPYNLSAALWYQGESNTSFAKDYRRNLPAMMADWRAIFGAELPFLIVQLPNYGDTPVHPVESDWSDVREAQRVAVRNDRHAALVVTVDIGSKDNLHPPNKQELGRRLAIAARHLVYGEAIAPSGPEMLSATRKGKQTVIAFGHVTGHLEAEGGAVASVELCGRRAGTCRFVPARLSGDSVILSGGQAGERIRYCWGNAPVCTLQDDSGLPAGPFEVTIR